MKPCLVLLLATVALAADAPKVRPLTPEDRLQIREAQLELAQAHIARLQAEAGVAAAEDKVRAVVQSMKSKYACLDCTLNNDFTWEVAKPSKPKKEKDK